MHGIPLSDEENYAILAEIFTESLGDLGKDDQRQAESFEARETLLRERFRDAAE